jgi:hypothetical protein
MSQQNQSTLQSAINTQLADNTSGAISAADVRDNLINMTDSLLFNSGSQGITGSLTATSFTGSLEGTATTASYVVTAQTASYVLNAVSASRAATASISTFANSSNNILHADLNSNGDYAITFTSGIGYATVLCRLNQATGLSPFTYNPSTSLLKITGSIIATGGFTGSLLGTATTASFASTASYIPVAQTLVDANLPLVLINGNSLVKDQYESIVYNPLNNLLTVVANTDFSGPITSVSSISSTGGFTGSLLGTATTASYVETAQTASYVNPLIQNVQLTGSLNISNSIILTGTFNHGLGTTTTGDYSQASGLYSDAIGPYSRAHGVYVTANSDYSCAEGQFTFADGFGSHAEGEYTRTIGNFSHAEGLSTTSSGNYSHAEGIGTIASGLGQHVGGRYNTQGDSTSLMIVGNGTADGARKDAFKVRMSGSIVLPTTSSGQPSWTGTNGEIIAGTDGGGNNVLWVYLGGSWLTSSLGI